jgi:uncharacterized protein
LNATEPRPRGVRQARLLSGGEWLLGAALVIGHNVYRLLPNEVPILVLLAVISMRLRNGAWIWSALGFRRPASWSRLIALALAAAAVRILLGSYAIDPLTSQFWPAPKAPAGAQELTGHFSTVLLYLPVVWGFAAFGEEIGYRGYLLNKLSETFGQTRLADAIAVVGSAILFGIGHFYKGPAGIIDSGVAGLILGAVFLLSGRNLWSCILAHGFIDTFGLFAVYLGWDT